MRAKGIDHGPGIGRQGTYAESVAVRAGMPRRLPATVSDADGALIEPLAVAIRAIKVSAATPDERHMHGLAALPKSWIVGAVNTATMPSACDGPYAVVRPVATARVPRRTR